MTQKKIHVLVIMLINLIIKIIRFNNVKIMNQYNVTLFPKYLKHDTQIEQILATNTHTK